MDVTVVVKQMTECNASFKQTAKSLRTIKVNQSYFQRHRIIQ